MNGFRILWWRFGAGEAPFGTCGHCHAALTACPRCDGAWQGRACTCGVGVVCPSCHRHWG